MEKEIPAPPLSSLFSRVNLPIVRSSLSKHIGASPRPLQRLGQGGAGARYFVNPVSLSELKKGNSGNKSYKNMRTIGKKSLSYRFVSCSA